MPVLSHDRLQSSLIKRVKRHILLSTLLHLRRRGNYLIICPCCGFKSEGELMVGCDACGARAVGPPLARPQHELPSYGRAFLIGVTGVMMLGVLAGFTISTMLQNGLSTTSLWAFFWSGVSAAE